MSDLETILAIINDGARAYKGVIPADLWREPYMSSDELRHAIVSGIKFSGAEIGGNIIGVMGVEARQDVMLIRHAYVRTNRQKRGIGTALLYNLKCGVNRPFLIGTWSAARWAIWFYENNGFSVVGGAEKDRLLKTYWEIPDRQAEESIVLVDPRGRREIVRSQGKIGSEVSD